MNFLDPNNESSWRNEPAPLLDPSFHAALREIGGLNTFGLPNLRIVWGQEHRTFQRGKPRLRYVDRRIPAIEHTRHVLKRPLTFDATGRALSFERKVFSDQPKVVPKGWLYELELESVEFIGDQLFYVEQWVPPDLLGDTPQSWETLRYEDWEDPEIGLVRHCDVLGPFPSEGQYRDVFAVGEPYVYPTFTESGEGYEGEYLRFRMPGADTLEALREKMFRRENEVLPSAAQRSKDRFYNYNHNKERQFDKYREERRAWFRDALNTTGKREALARTMKDVPSTPPVSVSVPLEFPRERLFPELQKLNRHQRRAQGVRERRAA